MLVFSLLLALSSPAFAHISPWMEAMWGFNVTFETFDYDNRPVAPLMGYTFEKWWMHNHIGYPPHPDDVFELPAGQPATVQLACNKGATTYYASSEGGNIQNPDKPNDPCPGSPTSEYHTKGINDLGGCALGIAYKSDISQVNPEDIAIFSVNQTCVWNRYTDFAVPQRMPACPDGKCICAWFWIHKPDSGSEQMYMNGFQCNVTNSISDAPLATAKVARRCGADPENGKPDAVPGNCTYGAKQPLYWFQAERNNMFEGTYSPPFYNDLYNFRDGPQDDIFVDSYSSIPVPGPNQTELPVLANHAALGIPSNSGSGSSIPPASSPTPSDASGTVPSASTPTPSDASGTTPPPSPTPSDGNSVPPTTDSPTSSVNTPSPSATPGGSRPQCPSKRNNSAFSRRHIVAERRSPFTHKSGRRGTA